MYNFDKRYLGAICKYGHEYETSGKGLRYLSNRCCAECTKMRHSEQRRKSSYKEYSREYSRKYYKTEKGRNIVLSVNKKYHSSERGKKNQRAYRQSDKAKVWRKKQLVEHTQVAIRDLLRSHVWSALKKYSETGKIMSSKKYGINYDAIIKYLGPHPNTLGIPGKYQIDHKYPLSRFDLNNPEHIKVAFDPENHQWLSEEENLKKHNKIPKRSDIPKALLKRLAILD